ncbi:hypothetical protein ACKVWM_011448 [Pyricularia oryzae]
MMGITAAISPGAAQDFRITIQKELTGTEETASNGQQKSSNSGRGELLVFKEVEETIAFVFDDNRDNPPGSPVPAGKHTIPENHTIGPVQATGTVRHISTAVVLCILALGEICLHKDRIPDIVPTFGEMHSIGSLNSQPCGSRGSPAFQNSVPSHPKRSRRASFQSSASTSGPRKNIDVIPGLHYLANAIDVIGNQMAGMFIWHVYANILAGLYYGQLGRVMESYWQIYYACVKVQHLFRKCIVSLWYENGVVLVANVSVKPLFSFYQCQQEKTGRQKHSILPDLLDLHAIGM